MINKVDANQKTIIKAFRDLGYTVLPLNAVKQGCPDLLVADWRGFHSLVEVKTETGKLNERQKKFKDNWNGNIFIVRTVDDVIKFSKGKLK